MSQDERWETGRIARAGGLSKLNREQRKYVRKALETVFENGGQILPHRCHTNATLLSMMDFVHGNERIAAVYGVAVEGSEHSWCEIDGTPFEITWPLVDGGWLEARKLTVEGMRTYKMERFHLGKNTPNVIRFLEFVCAIFATAGPFNANLSPELAAALLGRVGHKVGIELMPDDVAQFELACKKVRDISDEVSKAGRLPGESVPEFQKRWDERVESVSPQALRDWLTGLCGSIAASAALAKSA